MRVAVALIGLVAGILAGVAVLLLNPLAQPETSHRLESTEITRLSVADSLSRGMASGPLAMLGLGGGRGSGFADPALRHARVSVVVLAPDEGGRNALAVKLAAPSPRNNLLRGRLFANSVWNLVWPGHGSLFLVGADDYWPMLEDLSWSALSGDGLRLDRDGYPLVGQLPRGRFQGVVGAAGALADFAGRYREWTGPGGALQGGYVELEPHTR